MISITPALKDETLNNTTPEERQYFLDNYSRLNLTELQESNDFNKFIEGVYNFQVKYKTAYNLAPCGIYGKWTKKYFKIEVDKTANNNQSSASSDNTNYGTPPASNPPSIIPPRAPMDYKQIAKKVGMPAVLIVGGYFLAKHFKIIK